MLQHRFTNLTIMSTKRESNHFINNNVIPSREIFYTDSYMYLC